MPFKTYHEVLAVKEDVFALLEQTLLEDRVDMGRFIVERAFAELFPDGERSYRLNPRFICDGVVSTLNFMRQRDPDEDKVRVYNPTEEEHGWTCNHTVIEIVTDEMPFLIDSIVMELNAQGCTIHLVTHPTLPSIRRKRGILHSFSRDSLLKPHHESAKEVSWETLVYIEIDHRQNKQVLNHLEQRLRLVLEDNRRAVKDWQRMRERTIEIIRELDYLPDSVNKEEIKEARAFLEWIQEKHFVFLGCRDYAIDCNEDGGLFSQQIPDTGLGILEPMDVYLFESEVYRPSLTERAATFINQPEPLYLIKAGRLSPIHRRVRLDVIGVRCFNSEGKLVKIRLIVGLFASSAYSSSAETVPIVRKKIAWTLEQVALRPDSHNGKALFHILQTLPRDELFLYDRELLLQTVIGILSAQQHRRTGVFIRLDSFERYISCLIFVPREVYDTPLRHSIERLLAETWSGSIEAFHAMVADSPLARLHIIVKIPLVRPPCVSSGELVEKIVAMSRPWGELLNAALINTFGENTALRIMPRYVNAFPASFRESHTPEEAVRHIRFIEKIFGGSSFELSLSLEKEESTNFKLCLYHPETPIPLSDVLPVLENMGFRVLRESPYEVRLTNAVDTIWLHVFYLQAEKKGMPHLDTLNTRLEETFLKVWEGEAENDPFNQLVLFAGLEWRTVVLLRAYAKYLRQIRFSYSQETIIKALISAPEISAQLVAFFDDRFNPALNGDHNAAYQKIEQALEGVENFDYDRIYHRYLDLIKNTLRTNFYQKLNGQPKNYVSFKLDSGNIEDLPSPRPWVEIWVYSPRVEAVHLRAGKVARGGIRWSERREDFRTEILGLLKSQIIQNAVTVAAGAKGGYILKSPPDGREPMLLEGVECYRIMIQGLLDITDNLEGDTVIPPPDVIRLDEDDPYLVVAGERGTSSFSDIANAIALEYGYWLGDAFASSGSYGYDRRTMGITARGAWESLKRHFHELGMDAETEDFTVIGIGDMSGDVFGNGMLRSPNIQLVAAFDDTHIFLDPHPTDTFASFNERLRLFQTPHSRWSDYSPSLVSTGGGIFSRSAKSIPITPQMKERFGIRHDVLSPVELVKALLRAPVDVLWFGGIGTFVKAGEESHQDADDRTNDLIRVNATELRCQAVVEGATLGLTQRARVEYAKSGGHINIDAVDSSAGVDTSDHEVNIKVLLNDVMTAENMTLAQRNLVFHSTTDEVSDLVLRNTYLQTQRISSTLARAPVLIDRYARLMRTLEKSGQLDRQLYDLPDEEDLLERKKGRQGLLRPEIAVLMSHVKLALFDRLIASDFPEDPYLSKVLSDYFPSVLRERFSSYMGNHKLRREIIATSIANDLVNRCGCTVVPELEERTGCSVPEIARAYLVACITFDLPSLWEAIEAMDSIVQPTTQIALLHAIEDLLEQSMNRILKRGVHPIDVAECGALYAQQVAALFATLPSLLSADMAEALQTVTYQMESQGTSTALARRVARLMFLSAAPDIADLCQTTGTLTADVARCYFNVDSLFGLSWLRENLTQLSEGPYWQRHAAWALLDDLVEVQRRLTVRSLADPSVFLGIARRYHRQLTELKSMPVLDLASLSVVCRDLLRLSKE